MPRRDGRPTLAEKRARNKAQHLQVKYEERVEGAMHLNGFHEREKAEALAQKALVPPTESNPYGSLKKAVQQATGDGQELLVFLVAIMRNDPELLPPEQRAGFRPTMMQRMMAAEMLANRGYGKPTQTVEHTGADGGQMAIELKWTDTPATPAALPSPVVEAEVTEVGFEG